MPPYGLTLAATKGVMKDNPAYDPANPTAASKKIWVTEEQNADFKAQGWSAVSEARKNYKANSIDKRWQRRLDRKVKVFERKIAN